MINELLNRIGERSDSKKNSKSNDNLVNWEYYIYSLKV